jgi:hypothetical protein
MKDSNPISIKRLLMFFIGIIAPSLLGVIVQTVELANNKTGQRIILFGNIPISLGQKEADIQINHLKNLFNKNQKKLSDIRILYEGRPRKNRTEIDQLFALLEKPLREHEDFLHLFDTLEKQAPGGTFSNIEIRELNKLYLLDMMLTLLSLQKKGLLAEDMKTQKAFKFIQSLPFTLQDFLNDRITLIQRMETIENKLPASLKTKIKNLIVYLKNTVKNVRDDIAIFNSLKNSLDLSNNNNLLTYPLYQICDLSSVTEFSPPRMINIIEPSVIRRLRYEVKELLHTIVMTTLRGDQDYRERLPQHFEFLYQILITQQPVVTIFAGVLHIEDLISLLVELGYSPIYNSQFKSKNDEIINFSELMEIINKGNELTQANMTKLWQSNNPVSIDDITNPTAFSFPIKPIPLHDFDRIFANC